MDNVKVKEKKKAQFAIQSAQWLQTEGNRVNVLYNLFLEVSRHDWPKYLSAKGTCAV